MACVAPGHYGGDAGGDPPEDRQPKHLPYQCEGSGKRGPTKHKALKKNFKQNNNKPLEIEFDVGDLKTFKPVGPYAANLSTYIGELVRKIPQYYESWDKVPAAEKATLIPNLQRYFQLERHLRDQTVILVKNEKRTVGSLVRAGLQKDFAKSYKDNKNKFKKRWFDSANSVEEARNRKPPKWKAGDDEWQKLVNFWASPERMKQSERNSRNRSKNKVTTHQGSMSFAQGRHQFVWFFIILYSLYCFKVFMLFTTVNKVHPLHSFKFQIHPLLCFLDLHILVANLVLLIPTLVLISTLIIVTSR